MPVRKSVMKKAGETYEPDEPDGPMFPAEAVFPLGWDIPLRAVPVPVYRYAGTTVYRYTGTTVYHCHYV